MAPLRASPPARLLNTASPRALTRADAIPLLFTVPSLSCKVDSEPVLLITALLFFSIFTTSLSVPLLLKVPPSRVTVFNTPSLVNAPPSFTTMAELMVPLDSLTSAPFSSILIVPFLTAPALVTSPLIIAPDDNNTVSPAELNTSPSSYKSAI